MTEQGAQLYQLSIVATGEVRDKDGNLISEESAEGIHLVTAEQAAHLIAEQDNT